MQNKNLDHKENLKKKMLKKLIFPRQQSKKTIYRSSCKSKTLNFCLHPVKVVKPTKLRKVNNITKTRSSQATISSFKNIPKLSSFRNILQSQNSHSKIQMSDFAILKKISFKNKFKWSKKNKFESIYSNKCLKKCKQRQSFIKFNSIVSTNLTQKGIYDDSNLQKLRSLQRTFKKYSTKNEFLKDTIKKKAEIKSMSRINLYQKKFDTNLKKDFETKSQNEIGSTKNIKIEFKTLFEKSFGISKKKEKDLQTIFAKRLQIKFFEINDKFKNFHAINKLENSFSSINKKIFTNNKIRPSHTKLHSKRVKSNGKISQNLFKHFKNRNYFSREKVSVISKKTLLAYHYSKMNTFINRNNKKLTKKRVSHSPLKFSIGLLDKIEKPYLSRHLSSKHNLYCDDQKKVLRSKTLSPPIKIPFSNQKPLNYNKKNIRKSKKSPKIDCVSSKFNLYKTQKCLNGTYKWSNLNRLQLKQKIRKNKNALKKGFFNIFHKPKPKLVDPIQFKFNLYQN